MDKTPLPISRRRRPAKEIRFIFRMTAELYAKLGRLADTYAGGNMSHLLRQLIEDKAKELK